MRILIVEDKQAICEEIEATVRRAAPLVDIVSFVNPFEALLSLSKDCRDAVLLDLDMDMVDGLSMAGFLKKIIPNINLIFLASHNRYVREAMQMHASGYIVKPVTEEKIRYELSNIRYTDLQNSTEGLRVQTFGNFEVFYNNEPVKFQYSKTKEMFAYLIDRRGSMCTNGELEAVLWENEDAQKTSYLKRIRKDLLDTLNQYNKMDLIVRKRGEIGIVPDRINCDYYAWLKGLPSAVNTYAGEYMSQYSWGEVTHAAIDNSASLLIS